MLQGIRRFAIAATLCVSFVAAAMATSESAGALYRPVWTASNGPPPRYRRNGQRTMRYDTCRQGSLSPAVGPIAWAVRTAGFDTPRACRR